MSASSGEVRVGVVGAGWVAKARHIPAFRRLKDVRIVGVADHHIENAREAVSVARQGESVTSLADLLRLDPHVIAVATSPWSHAELSIESLRAGCHVFCEKPMALNLADARAMEAEATKADRLLCVSHNLLFSRTVRRAESLLAQTSPTFVSALQLSSYARRLPTWYQDLPGGLMLDESPHLLYVLTHFLGAPLRIEHVRASGDIKSGTPSTIDLLLAGNRAAGSIVMSFDTPISEWHVGVITPQLIVGMDLFRDIVTPVRPDGEHKAFDILRTSGSAIANQLSGSASTGVRIAARRQFWGHDELIRRFVDACRAGGKSPIDLAESVSIVALTDDLLLSLGLR